MDAPETKPEQAPKAEDALHRRLRLLLLRVPLAMPLLAVVGTLLPGQFQVAALVALLLPLALGLRRIAVCALLCAAVAALHVHWRQGVAQSFHAAFEQEDVILCRGTVVDMLGKGCVLEPEGGGTLIALRGDMPFSEGDFVALSFAPREAQPPPIRGMFDREAWMQGRGISMEGDFISGQCLEQRSFCWATLRGVARGIRDELARQFIPPGTEEEASRQVLAALILGAREHAEADTMVGFRRSGCLHAFAVSGQHVALFSLILWGLLRLLRVHPTTGRWLQIVVLGFYVVVTGFSVPAVRAYVMLVVLLLGLSLRRRICLSNAWCAAALLVLLVEPWQLTSAGFLLSFTIYAAICIGIRFCMRGSAWLGPDPFIPPRIYTPGERRQRALDYSLRGTVIVSLCAWLISLPLTARLFHTFNTLGFITNILIAPLILLVMVAGLAMLLLGWLPWLGGIISSGALGTSGLLLSLTSFMGSLPGAYLPATTPQPAHAAMVLGTGYGRSCCVLGNPGLVIDCGNEESARFRVEPALFHAGFSPNTLLLSHDTGSQSDGAALLRLSWPDMQTIRAAELQQKLTLSGTAGRFTIFPAPRELPRSPAANQAPIVLWESPDGRRVLYIGDASQATADTLSVDERRADIVILGRNPKRPMEDVLWLRSCEAKLILLLPSASESKLSPALLAPARLLQMDEEGCLQADKLF